MIINNAYDCIHDEYARELWAKIMALKIAGYRSEYNYGVLPVDTSDFYSHHMAIFEKLEGGELKAILGCKSIGLNRHKEFSKDEFVLVDHFRRSNALDHMQAIRDLVKYAEDTRKNMHYLCSYTTDPALRGNPIFSQLLRDVFTGMYVNFHLENKIDLSTAAGAKRFKVDRLIEAWGYDRLKLKGEPLGDYNPACIHGHDAVFFATEKFSDYGHECARKYQVMWESRVQLDKETVAAPDWAQKKSA